MDLVFAIPAIYNYVLSIFVFFTTLHARDFEGPSAIFGTLLMVVAAAGWLSKIVFLVVYGFRTTWWAPFAIAGIDLLAGGFLQGIAAKILPERVLSVLGIIAIPVFGFLMFYSM